MKAPLFLVAAMTIILSCNHSGGGGGAIDSPSQLTDSCIYNIDSVRAVINAGDEKGSGKKLSAAIDIYLNVKDAAKSIPIFKSAIRLKPSAKAYFQLGCALLDDDRPREAVKALHIAEQLDYSPLANVMFRLSAAYARSRKADGPDNMQSDSLALHYMEVALQMGYARPEQFRTMDYFAGMRDEYRFGPTYNAALSGNGASMDPEKMLWKTFTGEFESLDLPLTINTVWIQAHAPKNSISFDYEKFIPEMRNAKFSREVEKEYYYFALLKKDAAYTALLYAGKNNFLSDANQQNPVFFILTTYDANGKIIDKMDVAGQRTFTDTWKVLSIRPDYSFEVKDYKNIFKYDPEQVGYDSNYVVRSEPLGTAVYRIAANGKFEKTDAPLAMR